MDMKSIRTLNLVGTILFGIFNIIVPLIYLPLFGFIFFMSGAGSIGLICITIMLIWILIVTIMVYKLYTCAVRGIDEGDYQTAKRWTIIGAIIGLIFGGGGGVGIITFIIFLISFLMFDDALRKLYYPQPYGYYPQSYYPPPGYPPLGYPPPGYPPLGYPPPGYPPPGYPPPGYPPHGYPDQKATSNTNQRVPEKLSISKKIEYSKSRKKV